ncbi:phosphotransferase [Streptomyces sp. SL13]|uniref:Phosphotransferase n=1 Tax=Streptantibioticus silvisoli TaxID=2705255 RepID=A0AA90H2R3_9ACTN|nr:phosphotransferase [Streptantibioticus silvisoli]MDI5969908.1 phosphotransferase [Streptantibioticus silvisoli]
MTAPAPLHGGFAESELHDVLDRACAQAGLDATGAELLRGHTNAVFRLRHHPVVVKIASKGSPTASVERTVALVQWLMDLGFPTVPLHPVQQPVLVDNQHAATFWTYLPQDAAEPITAHDLADPLHTLHALTNPPIRPRELNNIGAIRYSLAAITLLPDDDMQFLSDRADQLEDDLQHVQFAFPDCVVQGDPQHRNALRAGDRTVLCDWDTLAWGAPDWDLVTIEVHCRRFGYAPAHYEDFTAAYGFDIRTSPGYPVLRDIRELRMITTNARKARQTPGTINEVRERIAGLRRGDTNLRWHIL